MLTGTDYIFIFQSAILVTAYFVFLMVFFQQKFQPKSLFILAFGLLILELSHYLLLATFETYTIDTLSILIIIGPVLEELFKIVVIFYLIVSQEKSLTIRKITYQGTVLGLGFGVGELIGYSLVYGIPVLLQRSVLLMFTHPLFGGLLAYSTFVLIKTREIGSIDGVNKRLVNLWIMLPLTISLHSLWNLVLVIDSRIIFINVLFHGLGWYGLIWITTELSEFQNDNLKSQ